MIVIDSSALAAILRDEPQRRVFIDAIVDHGEPRLSAATYVEASMVMELRLGDRGGREVDVLMEDVGLVIVPVDQAQATIARRLFAASAKAAIGQRRTPAIASSTPWPGSWMRRFSSRTTTSL